MGSSTGYPSAIPPPVATEECDPHPFIRNIVQLTQAEHIELKWKGNYWKTTAWVFKRAERGTEAGNSTGRMQRSGILSSGCMARRVRRDLQGEIHFLMVVLLQRDLEANKKGAKDTAARPGLICPLLKRSEMLPLNPGSAAFVGKPMICCRTRRTQGLLRSRSKPMFV